MFENWQVYTQSDDCIQSLTGWLNLLHFMQLNRADLPGVCVCVCVLRISDSPAYCIFICFYFHWFSTYL